MSHISQGNELTSSEIEMVQNLRALATSGAGEAIRKTGATTFANVSLGAGGGTVPTFEDVASGAVDDSNMTFVLTNDPFALCINGQIYPAGEGMFASYDSGTKTATLAAPVGSTGFIRNIYLA